MSGLSYNQGLLELTGPGANNTVVSLFDLIDTIENL